MPVTGLALIDPVARFVDQPMDIPPNVQGQVLSVIADHEARADFRPLHYGNDPRVTEVHHPGNHVGVGGGYDRHGTAANVLEGVTGYLQRRGVAIADVAPENRHRSDAPQKLYSEAYQAARNGDVLTDKSGRKQGAWRIDDPEKGRVAAAPKMTELSPGLKAHGLSAEQCVQVGAACTVCAARHAPDWGVRAGSWSARTEKRWLCSTRTAASTNCASIRRWNAVPCRICRICKAVSARQHRPSMRRLRPGKRLRRPWNTHAESGSCLLVMGFLSDNCGFPSNLNRPGLAWAALPWQ